MAKKRSGEIQISKSGLKNLIIGFIIICTLIFGFIILEANSNNSASSGDSSSVVTQSGDTQIIEVTAKGGYTPGNIIAKANTPTILRMKTSNTYDCSSAFTIPSLKIRKNLPSNGITEFNIAAQTPGTKLTGTCSMGMYRFTINFES